ncbi:MAG TPA: hypothetical protein VFQ23_14115 [Anaerolineales bacterium]|nr:hypothetical protein [Anaerolineales bacterium]
MSYELLNPYTTISRTFSRQFWSKALALAELYGWQPMGTEPPSEHDFDEINAEWDGTYLTNDGQMIKAQDALSLAFALQNALKDIPGAKIPVALNAGFWMEADLPDWFSPDELEMVDDGLENELLDFNGTPPLEFFAGDEKEHLQQFIRFCRLGNFVIS